MTTKLSFILFLHFGTLTTSAEMEIKLYHMKVNKKSFAHKLRGNDVEHFSHTI